MQQPTLNIEHPELAAGGGGAGFPLILTFSPGEKEQPLDALVKFVNRGAEAVFRCAIKVWRGFAEKLGVFLPLPEGEGRGEGKRDARLERIAETLKAEK